MSNMRTIFAEAPHVAGLVGAVKGDGGHAAILSPEPAMSAGIVICREGSHAF
jgi:hypothetical protein